MARVTVEDCLGRVENRFELVMLASKRAHQIASGGKEPYVPADNDKPTVIALREIAEGLIHRDNVALVDAEEFEHQQPVQINPGNPGMYEMQPAQFSVQQPVFSHQVNQQTEQQPPHFDPADFQFAAQPAATQAQPPVQDGFPQEFQPAVFSERTMAQKNADHSGEEGSEPPAI